MTPFGRACVVSKCIQGKFETAPTRQHHYNPPWLGLCQPKLAPDAGQRHKKTRPFLVSGKEEALLSCPVSLVGQHEARRRRCWISPPCVRHGHTVRTKRSVMRGVRTDSLIEEWTQTKAWWKRRSGWKNVRRRYKTENKFVLAISNQWFEMSGPSKARNKKPSLQVLLHQNATMNFSPFLSVARQLALAMIQTNRMGGDKNWAFSGVLSGVVVAMAARTAVTRSNDENSLFVLLLCPFADVSNLRCGFIRLFPKQRVPLVEGFSSESFFGRFFGRDWHVLQNVLNPGEPCAL